MARMKMRSQQWCMECRLIEVFTLIQSKPLGRLYWESPGLKGWLTHMVARIRCRKPRGWWRTWGIRWIVSRLSPWSRSSFQIKWSSHLESWARTKLINLKASVNRFNYPQVKLNFSSYHRMMGPTKTSSAQIPPSATQTRSTASGPPSTTSISSSLLLGAKPS
jgi:hypothetical protein